MSPNSWSKFAFELLEERAMLSVSQDLYEQIAPYQSAFNTALRFAGNLTLVGDENKKLQEPGLARRKRRHSSAIQSGNNATNSTSD